MQPANECECKNILTTVGNIGQLDLKVAIIGLEAVALPHLDGEKVVVIPLGLLTRGILSEECFDYPLEVVKRKWW